MLQAKFKISNDHSDKWSYLQINKITIPKILALITKGTSSCSQTVKPWGMWLLDENLKACAPVRSQHRPVRTRQWGKKVTTHDICPSFFHYPNLKMVWSPKDAQGNQMSASCKIYERWSKQVLAFRDCFIMHSAPQRYKRPIQNPAC